MFLGIDLGTSVVKALLLDPCPVSARPELLENLVRRKVDDRGAPARE